jgi:hypothetical protein
MQATIENIDHLTRDEQTAVKIVASTINTPIKCKSREDALNWTRLLEPWFIYEGGNHLAVHRASGDTRRILIVTL